MEKDYTRRDFLKKFSRTTAGIFYLASPMSSTASTFSKNDYDFTEDSEHILLAKLAYGEARELLREKDHIETAMILFTPINRAKSKIAWNGRTIKEAILKKSPRRDKKTREIKKDELGKPIYVHQYSCFNSWDPNSKELKNPKKYDLESWKRAMDLSEKILRGKFEHLNYGQDHYYRKNTKTPGFAKDQKRYKKYGPQIISNIYSTKIHRHNP